VAGSRSKGTVFSFRKPSNRLRPLADEGLQAVPTFAHHVHPESIPLLEPKPGGIVEEQGSRTKLKKQVPANFPLTGTGYVILQRSGRPFFTPIKEG
jgi:hypothetical protein